MNRLGVFGLILIATGCGGNNDTLQPIFVDGRAVAAVGDSGLVMTGAGVGAVVYLDRNSGARSLIGEDELESPVQVQWMNDTWYVSDVQQTDPVVVLLDATGNLIRTVSLARRASASHQFAALPDGQIVFEDREGNLTSWSDDEFATFAEVEERSQRPGLIVASDGGLIHGVPGQFITLYNGFGSVRWRVEWPLAETAFVSDIAVDSHGRTHMIAGIARDNSFRVYSLSTITGEVNRWSEPGAHPTFLVARLGALTATEPDRWIGEFRGDSANAD